MLKNRLAFLYEVHGPGAIDRVIADMPIEHQDILDQPLLPTNWITMDASAAFLNSAAAVLGGDRVIYEMGISGAQKSLSGIYKIFVRVGSPGFIVKRGAGAFKQLFDGGHSEANAERRGDRTHAVWRSYGFATHHRLIEVVMHGWMIAALRLSGAQVDRSEITVSLSEELGYFEIEGSWPRK